MLIRGKRVFEETTDIGKKELKTMVFLDCLFTNKHTVLPSAQGEDYIWI